jgi:hypothetical protein
VRALLGAFVEALAAGVPTRTSAQVSAQTMRFGPAIVKGIGFARLSPGMATMTFLFRLRYAMGPSAKPATPPLE